MKRKWICALSMLLAVCYSIGLIASACSTDASKVNAAEPATQAASLGRTMGYEEKIFDRSRVHTLDIQIDESDWQDLKENAVRKEYHDCTLVVDGEPFYHVGVRTKGNSTLVQSIVRDWDRHSLVFSFGEFNASQRYYGLDELMIYNNACDSSFMKTALCQDLMREMGLASPLCSYTALYLNGEYVGLYTAVERVSESFAVRNYGYDHGQLYKPEQFDVAGILTGETTSDVHIDVSALTEDSSESHTIEISNLLQVPANTVALQYQGDGFEHYCDIWNTSAFKIGRSDKARLVNALKRVSTGEDLENAVDMQNLATYMAANAFVLNIDGYLTEMAHNYCLYEKDGKLSMIPWDYDLSLGSTGVVGDLSDMTAFINLGIDEPVLNTTVEERPMLACVLNDEQGRKMYDAALQKLVTEYIDSGWLENYLRSQTELILPYVISDPTSGVSEERFAEAVKSVYDFCILRSESIRGQLNGTIPTTAQAQNEHPETLINASNFSCPDSNSFMDMVFPKGSGLGFEDALRTLKGQLNFTAIFQMLPISSLKTVLASSSGSSMEKLVEGGYVQDEVEFRKEIITTVLQLVKDIGIFLLAVIALIVALVMVRRYGRNRRPSARKEARTHAV